MNQPADPAKAAVNQQKQRWVLHIDMDAFFASVEQLTRPSLRGRPVLVGGIDGRGVVAGASYEARALGAHSAQPMFQANRLVGFQGISVRPRFPVYKAASKRVFEIIHSFCDLVEPLSIDEAFLEPAQLQGATVEEVREYAEQLRAAIFRETGLPSSVGAGSGKQWAKIGSDEAKPNGVFIVPREEEVARLHPLPVRKLWGVGQVMEARLRELGIDTIGRFAEMDEDDVRANFHKHGVALWHLARGEDNRPVAPRAQAKQVSAERTYPADLSTAPQVDRAVLENFEDAYRRLQRDGRGARTVAVKLKLHDFTSVVRSVSLPLPTRDREILSQLAKRVTRYPDEVGTIRLVGVSFSSLGDTSQDVLFPELDQSAIEASLATLVYRVSDEDDYETGVHVTGSENTGSALASVQLPKTTRDSRFFRTQDVVHEEYGHGWVTGHGQGKVSVRFESRSRVGGKIRTFDETDRQLSEGDPLASLDWEEWLATHQE